VAETASALAAPDSRPGKIGLQKRRHRTLRSDRAFSLLPSRRGARRVRSALTWALAMLAPCRAVRVGYPAGPSGGDYPPPARQTPDRADALPDTAYRLAAGTGTLTGIPCRGRSRTSTGA